MPKFKIGTIFEIHTPKGKAYLHYIFQDMHGIDWLRVLPGLYAERPTNVSQLAASQERYIILFPPMTTVTRRKIAEKVAYYPAENFKKPQYMRSTHTVRGKFLGWHIIDTNSLQIRLVKKLSAEQKKLSPFGIWNDTLLIERLVKDWSLEKWEPFD